MCKRQEINPYATGLNFSCHLITLNGWATIVVVGRLRVKEWMHKKAIEWLLPRAYILCLEHHTVWCVYVMLGAKGLGLFVCLFVPPPHSCTVHLDTIKVFYLPTDAQESCFKRILKFTLKSSYMFQFNHHHQGA